MKQDLLFDKRLQPRFLRDKILKRDELDKYLSALPDASERALFINIPAGSAQATADAGGAKKKKP
ncbi:MAG: hypothetical protein KC609_11785 [Myxococcales bacterium]|nr:hypothetical protein [Myxococcales bacterium]